MTDIEKAKSLLTNDMTCVAIKGDTVYSSTKTGISPILDWILEGIDLSGFSVADKLIGKAAAMLLVKAKVQNVFTHTISEDGKKYLENHNVMLDFDEFTPYIINRTKTDICPMEKAVKDIDDFETGFDVLKSQRDKLRHKE